MLRLLLTLMITISVLTIIFALIDLRIVFQYTGDKAEDPLWFRVTLCVVEFGIWFCVYMTTFVVSYTYF